MKKCVAKAGEAKARLEQPGPVEDAPAHGEVGPDGFLAPHQWRILFRHSALSIVSGSFSEVVLVAMKKKNVGG